MVKEIERYGIPIIHMATITTISESVGANRILPTVAIPYPAGNPELPPEEEKSLRVSMVERAVDGLATQVDGPTHFE
jgi:glycine reductase